MLIKFSLSFMVVFSAVISYLLAPKVVEFDWLHIILLFVGGLLVTGSANTVNQIVEKDTDAMMARTAKRPVASGRMQPAEAWTFAIIAIAAACLSSVTSLTGYRPGWHCSAGLYMLTCTPR